MNLSRPCVNDAHGVQCENRDDRKQKYYPCESDNFSGKFACLPLKAEVDTIIIEDSGRQRKSGEKIEVYRVSNF